MKIAVTYATDGYKKALRYNLRTATKKGKVDRTIEYSPKSIDDEFRAKNKDILDSPRGGGYWLWKPYCINKALSEIQDGDYLIYLDAAAYYIKPVDCLIQCMEKNNDEIMVFESPLIEKKYVKRDLFVYLNCDEPKFTDTYTCWAGMVLLKKTPSTVAFIAKWLEIAQVRGMITDEANYLGKENYPQYIGHKYDQAVLSLLMKKTYGYFYEDPSQWGLKSHGLGLLLTRNWEIVDSTTRKTEYPMCVIVYRRSHISLLIKFSIYFEVFFPKIYLVILSKLKIIKRTIKG